MILGVARLGCEAVGGVHVAGEAGTGEEAIDVVRATSPTWSFSISTSPTSRASTCSRALRAGGFDGRVLVVSERIDGQVVLEASRLGADGFLGKPDGLRADRASGSERR